jgi:glycosyltransferase involved in cell wall biosynthesis
LYRHASLLAITSSDEGFGLPALEAMTLGLPVVSSARGSLPEVLGDAGLLVNADDPVEFPRAFAAAMSRVLTEPALRRDLAARGIARSRMFDWDAAAASAREALAAAVVRRGERA